MDQLKTLWEEHPYIVGGALAAPLVCYVLHRKLSGGKPSRPSCPRDTVLLYQFIRGPYAPSLSPFPIKLESYLRMANIPYINDHTGKMSSKHKTPWMSYNGVDVADSQFCIEYLNKKLNIDLNKGLSKEDKAVAHAIRVLVDEHLYWTLVYYRWVYDKNMTMVRLSIGRRFWMVRLLFKGTVLRQLHGQGLGRHSPEEIKHIFLTDLQTLSDYLGDKPFMMGQIPTEVDASVFGMVAQFVWQSRDGVCDNVVQEKFPNLLSYCERMRDRFWPDWDQCITHGGTRKATK